MGYAFLTIAVVLATLTLRLMSDGNARLEEAERAMEKGDRPAAVVALEDAAKAYVPGGLHVQRALRELAVLARAAEMRGDETLALKTWEVIRRSILATRHLFQPNSEALEEAEHAVMRLRRQGKQDSPSELIRRPDDPSPLLSALLFVGLAAWIFGAAFWALGPKRKDGAPRLSSVVSVSICLGGLALWLLAVRWV